MQKFIPGDKIQLERSKETENFINFESNNKIYFTVCQYLDNSIYLIVNLKHGYCVVDEKYIDFRFSKDRSMFNKYGSEFLDIRLNRFVTTVNNELISRKLSIFGLIDKNYNYGYINSTDIINNKYISTSVNILLRYVISDTYNGSGSLFVNKYLKVTEDYVDDYFSKNKFNIKTIKSAAIVEFNSTKNNIYYTRIDIYTKNLNSLPRIHVSSKDLLTDYPNLRVPLNVDKFGNSFIFCVSEDNAIKNGYKESFHNGMFFKEKSTISNKYFGYEEFANVCSNKLGGKSSSNLSTEGLAYTFGIEIEMQKCFIPNRLRPELNISCVRDGSINNRQGDRNGGPEFVTGVLTGDAGFLHLLSICNQITKRGELDQSCGLHVHIGGASFSEEFLVMSYILGQKLESQFFELVPKSRRNSQYCTKLNNLKFSFNNIESSKDFRTRCSTYYKELFKYLCGIYPDEKVNKNTNHPRGRTCGYDHSSPRYNWLNFVPAVFNTKNSTNSWTLEFRIHSGTSNFVKIRNWIKLCMAFVYFADNCHSDIINDCVTINGVKHPLTINNIINRVFPKTGNNLIKYLEDRKNKFNDDIDKEVEEYSQNSVGVLELNNVKEILD